MPWAAPDRNRARTTQSAARFVTCVNVRPQVPLIVDAGIGLPSHACQVMEWGFDGVLLNTAVSRALDPVQMAGAFANAIRAGRAAFVAGPMIVQHAAVPSTPEIGRPFTTDSLRCRDFFRQAPESRGLDSSPRLS